MATTFDEVLLPTNYSAIASGGQEWSTAVVRSGEGGSIASRAETREDSQGKYEIQFGLLAYAEQQALRSFHILRKGMARAFRFLAPDDYQLVAENVGWLNPATGEIEYLAATPASNTLDEFYLVKHHSDQANFYTRRIVKPSPFDDVLIEWYGDMSGTPTLKGSETIPANSTILPFNVIDTSDIDFVIFAPGASNFTFNFATGKVTSEAPLGDDEMLKVTCIYHQPVVFTSDMPDFKIDEVGLSELRVGIEEVLPIELNIT